MLVWEPELLDRMEEYAKGHPDDERWWIETVPEFRKRYIDRLIRTTMKVPV